MLKIIGYEIWRNGQRAGYVDGDKIRGHDNRILGYFTSDHVYNAEGRKFAFIEGDWLSTGVSSARVPLDKVNESIEGGALPEIGKCAVYLLIGA